jgi:hypothetical protein
MVKPYNARRGFRLVAGESVSLQLAADTVNRYHRTELRYVRRDLADNRLDTLSHVFGGRLRLS